MIDPTPEVVIGAYHQLWRIEQSFRMSKHDLQARPIYHRKRESIEAHLAVVFAALAVTRLIEDRTGWTIKRFVRTARRYRTVQIRAGQHLLTAEDPFRSRRTRRLRCRLGTAIAGSNRAVSDVADEYDVGWHTAHRALVALAASVLPEPAPTPVLGIDETRARSVRWLLEPTGWKRSDRSVPGRRAGSRH